MQIHSRGNTGCGWIGLIFMGLIFTSVGIGVGWFIGKPILDEAKASADWPSVKGKIIDSQLVRSRDKDGKSSYSADVIFKYTVDNEEYEGDNVWFGQYGGNRSTMQKIVKQYPKGKEVDVFYMPDDPNESVLQPGAFTSSYMVLVIGMIFAGVGVLMLAALPAAGMPVTPVQMIPLLRQLRNVFADARIGAYEMPIFGGAEPATIPANAANTVISRGRRTLFF